MISKFNDEIENPTVKFHRIIYRNPVYEQVCVFLFWPKYVYEIDFKSSSPSKNIPAHGKNYDLTLNNNSRLVCNAIWAICKYDGNTNQFFALNL